VITWHVMSFRYFERYETQLRSIMRIITAIIFSEHGWQKLFGVLGGFGAPGQTAPVGSVLWTAGLIEAVGGLLLTFGLFTRAVAFLLSGEMAVAYFRTHAPRGFWPMLNGGELAVFYCFFFLWLSSADPGIWSLDRLFFRRNPLRH
jgi:putative oxidoreductase